MIPYWTNEIATLYQTDARQLPLENKSVHCIVTSPPYYGLRVYKAEGNLIGLESSIEAYLESMMQVFDEIWRVLRDDGICWVNLGDSYGGSGKGQNSDGTHAAKHGEKQHTSKGTLTGGLPANQNHAQEPGTKKGQSGQLLMIPARFALAMQERGWILRDDVIWHKRSPMPESLAGTRWERHRRKWCLICHDFTKFVASRCQTCDDREYEYRDCPGCKQCQDNDGLILRNGSWRCTSSYEHIFMFVKSMGYWSDGEAVKTPSALSVDFATYANMLQETGEDWYPKVSGDNRDTTSKGKHGRKFPGVATPTGANRRNVWNDIKPEPFKGQHYATFPTDLPRLCIQASTSEAGCCAECGAQWARMMNRESHYTKREEAHTFNNTLSKVDSTGWEPPTNQTLDWRPACDCNAGKAQPLVLDPFCGTGTTLLAAQRLGRRGIGIDLSEGYLKMAVKRLSGQSLPMGALI